jgi:hypothetical protein
VTVTLPAPILGLEYFLIRTGNEEFVLDSTGSDDIIADGTTDNDLVTYTTASEHLGAKFHVYAVNDAGTVKWYADVDGALTVGGTG